MMIRDLKAPLLAAFAALVLGVTVVPSADAHIGAQKFTNLDGANTRIATKADGSGTTAHQVIDIPGNGAFTCNSSALEGTVSVFEPSSISLTGTFSGCTFLGQPATVSMNGCLLTFSPNGFLTLTGCGGPGGMTISAGGCTVTIPSLQSFPFAASYGNVGGSGSTMEITVSVSTALTVRTKASGAGCLTSGESTSGQITTMNMLFYGLTDPGAFSQKGLTVDF